MSMQDDIEKAYQGLPKTSIVEAHFQGTDSIRNFVVKVMEPLLVGQLKLNDRQTAIVGTYYRIIGWLKALGELDSLPHYQAVASGARSLFELLMDIKLIHSDTTGDIVQKFHAFPEIEKYRSASTLVSYCDRTNNETIECSVQRTFVNGEKRKNNIDSIVINNWGTTKNGKPNWPKHWSGKSVSKRAEMLGSECEALYYELYPFLSWHIHSGSTGYAGLTQDTIESAFGLMHNTIQKVALDATVICAEEMMIDRVDNLVKDFHATIEDLRKCTDRFILQKYSEYLKSKTPSNE
jgi:hypothetical protein